MAIAGAGFLLYGLIAPSNRPFTMEVTWMNAYGNDIESSISVSMPSDWPAQTMVTVILILNQSD